MITVLGDNSLFYFINLREREIMREHEQGGEGYGSQA